MYSLRIPSNNGFNFLYSKPTRVLDPSYTNINTHNVQENKYETLRDLVKDEELKTIKERETIYKDGENVEDNARDEIAFNLMGNNEIVNGSGENTITNKISDDPVARLRASISKETIQKYNIPL